MSAFARFAANCRIRHDFDDMIQVRYQHTSGQHYDTWVSGEEVLRRIRSMTAEERLQAIRRIDLRRLRELKNQLPVEGKKRFKDELRDRLGDAVEDAIGDDIIGESLAEAVRGKPTGEDRQDSAKARWNALLHEQQFRAVVLELSWIQLEGSFPESADDEEPKDWL